MKNTIISALNFNILKTNLSKIASKEVKIYVFENYFLKKKSCATVTAVGGWCSVVRPCKPLSVLGLSVIVCLLFCLFVSGCAWRFF